MKHWRAWLVAVAVIAPTIALAADFQVAGGTVPQPVDPSANNPGASYTQLIQTGFDIFLWVATAVAIFYLVYGGIQYITAGGDTEKATKARSVIINSVIGIIIIMSTFYIFNAARHAGTNPTDSTLSGL